MKTLLKTDQYQFEEGYCQAVRRNATQDSFTFLYYDRDHLGNIRQVTKDDGTQSGKVVQRMDYYPFGAQLCDGTTDGDYQPRRYSGKEMDRMHGLNTYDYGARQYNPVTARWDRVDPLSEKYYDVSPYAYCGNNPVIRIDKDGRFWDTIFDVVCLAYDVIEAGYQYCTTGRVSNTTKAAMSADFGALFLPGITGAGTIVRATKKTADVSIKSSGVLMNSSKSIGEFSKTIRPNNGLAKPHGGEVHNTQIDKLIEKLKNDESVQHIRKTQKQVDNNGVVVGNNRPDVLFDKDGVHTNVEFDTKKSSLEKHKKVDTDNDPNARNKFYLIK